MRLIDAARLTQDICVAAIFSIVCSALILPDGFRAVFRKLVAREPTIDRPARSQFKRMAAQLGYEPVVRCKDCKHRDPEDERCDCGCWHTPFTTTDNDFCSYGERRTDEQ